MVVIIFMDERGTTAESVKGPFTSYSTAENYLRCDGWEFHPKSQDWFKTKGQHTFWAHTTLMYTISKGETP